MKNCQTEPVNLFDEPLEVRQVYARAYNELEKEHPNVVLPVEMIRERMREIAARPSPVGDGTPRDEWRYEFRPGEKYPDLGIYTILASNPDAGKEGVVYSGAEVALADTDDETVAKQIVSNHKLAALVSQLVKEMRETRRTLEALRTCDHCAECAYCNSREIIRLEIAAIDDTLARVEALKQ